MGYAEYSAMTPEMKVEFAGRFLEDPELVAQFFDSLAAWGLRVRRDILAHELYFLMRHGTPGGTPHGPPHWEAFLWYLMGVNAEFTLSKDMSPNISVRMLDFLEEQIERLKRARGTNDPGDPPLPPVF